MQVKFLANSELFAAHFFFYTGLVNSKGKVIRGVVGEVVPGPLLQLS